MVLLAKYMEENDRALYVYYTGIADQAHNGKKISDTESTIIDIFINN